MNTNRKVLVGEIFTEDELLRAKAIYDTHTHNPRMHDMLVEQIVRPAMPRINRITGQPNDESYFAYVLEAIFMGVLAR